ncbi:mitotic interactor and substrate of PLK1 [Gastrophryne carolinensis]
MFKYPPPWQVLCGNLEKREQVSVNGVGKRSFLLKDDLITNYKNEYPHSTSYLTISCSDAYLNKETEDNIDNPLTLTVPQTDTTKESDLFEAIYANENQRPNTAEPILSTAAPESSMDRVTRSLIFSLSSSKSIDGSREDLINSTPEDGQEENKKRDVWLSSPERNAKLKVLREEERFEIRTHRPQTSPSKLFTDTDDEYDGKVSVKSHKLTPEKVWELENERKDIIKKQSQRKSLDAEDLIQFQDGTDSSKLNKEVNGTSGGQHKENVDTEQINFEAARKQFLLMEKKQKSLPITPHTQARPPQLSARLLYTNDEYLDFTKQKDPFILEQDVKSFKMNSAQAPIINGNEGSSSIPLTQSSGGSSVDHEDQERSKDLAREAVPSMIQEENESVPKPSDETPIEREIRLALQREASLRRERGIQHSQESNEIIEIQKYPVLSTSSETEKIKRNKDRSRTSFYVQREIEKEAQREADLKNEGKVAGLYDKGNSQEIDERKRLFEQPDIVSNEPQKIIIKTTLKRITADTQDNMQQVDPEHTNKKTDWTDGNPPLPYSVRNNWKPTPLNMYRTRRLSADNILDANPPKENSTAQETSQETISLNKENIHRYPLKSNLHVQENNSEKNFKLNRTLETVPVELYGAELRRSRSNLLEEEIRQTLERDRELQEQRRKSGFSPVTISDEDQQISSNNGYNQYRRSPITTENTSSWTPARWKSTPSASLPSYNTAPVEMYTPKRYPKFVDSGTESDVGKRQENWYAGIKPSDAVNTEIVESTRVSRHKSPMALRWEAGLYANEPSE